MRVLHVYRTYFPDTQGGLEEVIRQICMGTQKFGVENRVFTLSASADPSVIPLPEAVVYRFKKHFEIASCGVSLSSLKGFKQLAEWADIIHYHFPWPFADLLDMFVDDAKPRIMTYHSDIVRQKGLLKLYTPLMHHFLKSMSKIISTSPNYASTSIILEEYKDKVEVIPIGIHEETYPQVKPDMIETVRERFGEGFFLFIGVLRYYKGLYDLANAVRGTDIPIVIAGTGPEESKLKKLVAAEDNNIKFAGRVTDEEKVALLKLARGIVFPSNERSEAFGVTLLEGAMYGKALISTELGTGTSFVNQHGSTGLVVEPKQPEKLREALILLFQNNEKVVRFGECARKRYEEYFTGVKMGQAYKDSYDSLLA